MKYSKYKQKEINKLKNQVFDLYKQGYTLREVESLIKKRRTHAWIANVVKEKEDLSPDVA